MIEYNFLLNKITTQNFLNQNSKKIFGHEDTVEIIDIKRSKTYNPEAYNLLYKISRNNQIEFLRVSGSKIFSKKSDYLVMEYLFKNGFSKGEFLVPKSMAYFDKENLLFYENIPGRLLADLLEDDCTKAISTCGNLLRKIHSIPIPKFVLFDTNLFFKNFNFKSIISRYPELKDIPKIVDKVKNRLVDNDKKFFCHGDFNPNNILINQNRIYIIDFGLTCIFHKEVDLASFLTHLRLMLKKNNRENNFENLKNIFLSNYGEYDKEKLNLLMALIDIRLLEIAINYKDSGYDENFVNAKLNEDVQNSKINI